MNSASNFLHELNQSICFGGVNRGFITNLKLENKVACLTEVGRKCYRERGGSK